MLKASIHLQEIKRRLVSQIDVVDPIDLFGMWKQSGLTIDQVAGHFHRSRERAVQYCYCYKVSNKMRVELQRYYRQIIDKKTGTNSSISANVYKG